MSTVSMGGTDRLADIDRELDAFGKSDEVLAGVLARARNEAPQALSAVDAAIEALAVGVSVPAPANGHPVETRAPEGVSARPARWDEPATVPDDLPEDASGLVEIPEEELRRAALPPVLSLSDAAPHDTSEIEADEGAPTGVRTAVAAELELAGELAGPGSTADEGLDALFEGAPAASEPPAAAAGGLESLFEAGAPAPPPGAADGGLESLFEGTSLPPPVAEEPTGNTGLADLFESDRPEAEPAAHQSLADLLTPELQAELAADAGGDAEVESTSLFTSDDLASALAGSEPTADEPSLEVAIDPALQDGMDEPLVSGPPSGELELDFDEEAIVLDEEGEEAPAAAAAAPPPRPKTMPPPVPPGSQPPPPGQKGFFSRILNRK